MHTCCHTCIQYIEATYKQLMLHDEWFIKKQRRWPVDKEYQKEMCIERNKAIQLYEQRMHERDMFLTFRVWDWLFRAWQGATVIGLCTRFATWSPLLTVLKAWQITCHLQSLKKLQWRQALFGTHWSPGSLAAPHTDGKIQPTGTTPTTCSMFALLVLSTTQNGFLE